jgi:monoterpene epsilon-lactone hydrolase
MTWEQRTKIDSMLRSQPPAPTGTIEQQRAGYAAFMSTMLVPDGTRTTEVELGGLRTLLVEPEPEPEAESQPGTILFFHGGAWVVGSPETELGLTAGLVVRTGFRAYSPDYRLAPEHPFPAAVNDALAAYRALLDAGEDPATIAIAGDSAGGGLTITTLLAARKAGLPLPAAAVAFSPGLDKTRSGASMDAKAGLDPILSREGLQASCTWPAPTRTRNSCPRRSSPIRPASRRCCSRSAPTRFSSTTPPAWPPVPGTPAST